MMKTGRASEYYTWWNKRWWGTGVNFRFLHRQNNYNTHEACPIPHISTILAVCRSMLSCVMWWILNLLIGQCYGSWFYWFGEIERCVTIFLNSCANFMVYGQGEKLNFSLEFSFLFFLILIPSQAHLLLFWYMWV